MVIRVPLHAAWPVGVDDAACRQQHLPGTEYDDLQKFVEGNPVALLAYNVPMRCTLAAKDRFQAAGACFSEKSFADGNYRFGMDSSISNPIWLYHVCQYPDNKVGGAQMHSYVWIGGRMHGNGFDLLANQADGRLRRDRWLSQAALGAKLSAASADMSCGHQAAFMSDDRRELRAVPEERQLREKLEAEGAGHDSSSDSGLPCHHTRNDGQFIV